MKRKQIFNGVIGVVALGASYLTNFYQYQTTHKTVSIEEEVAVFRTSEGDETFTHKLQEAVRQHEHTAWATTLAIIEKEAPDELRDIAASFCLALEQGISPEEVIHEVEQKGAPIPSDVMLVIAHIGTQSYCPDFFDVRLVSPIETF
jgi:hypothetical protein